MVALWFRFGLKHRTPRIVWLGLVIALLGLAMVAQVLQGVTHHRACLARRLVPSLRCPLHLSEAAT